MLNPHAILLRRANFDEIVQATHASYDNLEEVMQDFLAEGNVPYVVFKRTKEGWPSWKIYTEEMLAEEYGITENFQRFNNHFHRI